MGHSFARGPLYRQALLQIMLICTGALMAYLVLDDVVGPVYAALTAGLVLGGTVIGGGLFTIIHTLSHVGGDFQSAAIRAGAQNHAAHHRDPHNPAHVRMSPELWAVTLTLHTLLLLPMPLLGWAEWYAASTFLLGIVIGSYVWFVKEEDGHVLAHRPPDQLTAAEAAQVHYLGGTFHRGHHDPEDATREERAPLALYSFQLLPELLCGKRFYTAIDRVVTTLEQWRILPPSPLR